MLRRRLRTLPTSSIVLALVLAACGAGSDPLPVDPHEVQACDASWTANGYDQCEAACVDSGTALGAMGAACHAATIDGAVVNCSKTFAFEDVVGCCASDPPRVLFAACE
jgi:hypothetical protein